MLRLAHRILQATSVGSVSDEDAAVAHAMQKDLTNYEVVVADNVAEFYEQWSLTRDTINAVRDFPSCRSPFEKLFIEWNVADKEFLEQGVLQMAWQLHADAPDDPIVTPETRNGVADWGNVDHVITSCIWLHCRNRSWPQISPIVFQGAVSRRGEMLSRVFGTTVPGANIDNYGQLSHIPMLTMSLLNCKNVATKDASAMLGPPDKWLRRQRQPRIEYKVLDINPMKEVLRTEGGLAENGLHKSLHICRGHFATYTDEAPLFGRVTGTFWKPAHVRGSIEHGAVVKDYAVNP